MAPVTRRNSRRVQRTSHRYPIPKDVLIELNPRHNKECMFCGRKEISEKLYGLLYQFNDVICHYFCILLSSRAVQNGTDSEGIWGFLVPDIKAELKRGSKETCVYCKKVGATISCCGLKCRKIFHLPCALENGSMHQYYQTFQSFCQQHRMIQTVDIQELQSSTSVQCSICREDVIPSPLPSSLWAPCCKRNAWFHRDCIQELALSAGYFFKCPLCNNVDAFKSRMLYLGIYVPSRNGYLKKLNHRDASWETVPNAYAELLERHSTCNAANCLCPHQNQRNYQNSSGSWEIILCHTCGSNGTHKLCSSLKCGQIWYCAACNKIAKDAMKVNRRSRRLEIDTGRCSNDILVPSGALGSPQNGSRHSNTIFRNTPVRESRDMVFRNIQPRPSRINTNLMARHVALPNTSTNHLLSETIVISDSDSDNDSDVQCITYIQSPRTIMQQMQNQMQNHLPVITNIYSSQSSSPVGNILLNSSFYVRPTSVRRNNVFNISSSHTLNNFITETIDLTNDGGADDNSNMAT